MPDRQVMILRLIRVSPIFLFVILLSGRAFAEDTVRVLVMDGLPGLALNFPKGYEVRQSGDAGVSVSDDGQGGVRITMDKDGAPDSGIRINADDMVVRINEFALSGKIEIQRSKKGYRIINELPLEDYTRAVVGEEMSSRWPIEALKAQAVAVRTYTLFKKRSCRGDYDLCSTVNSQMFTGGAREKEGAALAARGTEGEVLTYAGEVIEAVYHSTCGGETEDAQDVWDGSYPYLSSRECSYCRSSPYNEWSKKFSAGWLEDALRTAGYKVKGIESVKVSERSGSGRAMKVRIDAGTGGLTIKGWELRRILGYSNLPGTMFEVSQGGGSFTFTGKGSGHGVGLCQFGAKSMAEQGMSYREILSFYYPGAVLKKPGSAEAGE